MLMLEAQRPFIKMVWLLEEVLQGAMDGAVASH